ncbi:MAG: hypothetical protein ACRET5_00055 [Steroidobacteraceae bacterium]
MVTVVGAEARKSQDPIERLERISAVIRESTRQRRRQGLRHDDVEDRVGTFHTDLAQEEVHGPATSEPQVVDSLLSGEFCDFADNLELRERTPAHNCTLSHASRGSYNQKLWMHHRIKGATYPPS